MTDPKNPEATEPLPEPQNTPTLGVSTPAVPKGPVADAVPALVSAPRSLRAPLPRASRPNAPTPPPFPPGMGPRPAGRPTGVVPPPLPLPMPPVVPPSAPAATDPDAAPELISTDDIALEDAELELTAELVDVQAEPEALAEAVSPESLEGAGVAVSPRAPSPALPPVAPEPAVAPTLEAPIGLSAVTPSQAVDAAVDPPTPVPVAMEDLAPAADDPRSVVAASVPWVGDDAPGPAIPEAAAAEPEAVVFQTPRDAVALAQRPTAEVPVAPVPAGVAVVAAAVVTAVDRVSPGPTPDLLHGEFQDAADVLAFTDDPVGDDQAVQPVETRVEVAERVVSLALASTTPQDLFPAAEAVVPAESLVPAVPVESIEPAVPVEPVAPAVPVEPVAPMRVTVVPSGPPPARDAVWSFHPPPLPTMPALDGLDDLGDALDQSVSEGTDVTLGTATAARPAGGSDAPAAGAPIAQSRFADIVLGDEELDAIFHDLDAGGTQPSIPPAGPGPRDETAAPRHPLITDDATQVFSHAVLQEALVAPERSTEPSAGTGVSLITVDTQVTDDGETELVMEGDDEEIVLEIDVPTPDRGALLAATVTSRRKGGDPLDRQFASDARAEAEARADLLQEEAAHSPDPVEAARLRALAADLADGALGDRARARSLAEAACELDPTCALAIRVLRRIALAEGDPVAALARCEQESVAPLGIDERAALGMLAGELAAPRDVNAADRWWSGVARNETLVGAVAQLFAGAARHDTGRVGAALAAFAERSSGLVASATDVTRARLAEGAAEKDTALSAVRDAVQRDPTDGGGWLAMARIGLARASASVFREALAGLAAAGPGGSAAVAAEAVGRALDAVLGDPVAPGHVTDSGVAGWLTAHAQRDAGGDPSAQVAWGVENPDAEGSLTWRAWAGDPDPSASEAGRYHALRHAAAAHDDGLMAAAGAALVAQGGAVGAGLHTGPGPVAPSEVDALGVDGDAVLAAALAAAAGRGMPATETAGGDRFRQVAATEVLARAGERGGAQAAFHALADATGEGHLGVVAYAARRAAALGDDDLAYVEALRTEALLAGDPARAAALRMVAGALAAPLEATSGASDALAAARSLPGDLAAAELAALYALRAEVPSDVGADLLEAAAGDGTDAPRRMAAVRAALRRAAVDPDAAAVAIWRAWRRNDGDAALGVLLLRAPAGDPERTVSVLRAQADRASQAAGAVAATGAAVGTLLADTLATAGRHAEAVQAIARARALALRDTSVEADQERIWLGAGMHAEVAERAFDQLKAAPDDARRIAAYEKLAELDRAHRGDVASSVLSYQAILELAPGHTTSLRTLERYFLEQGRHEELLGIYGRMVRHAQDPADAVAAAHAAARLASAQADGDAAAGMEFMREAFTRGAPDRRLLMALDADARWSADLTRFAAVHAQAVPLVPDGQEMERAVHGCRAGEAFAVLGRHPEALSAFEQATRDAPGSVVARAGLAREREVAGDLPGAATEIETLGASLRAPEPAVAAWLQAAGLWDRAGDAPRALNALRKALARNPRQPEVVERVLKLLRDARDEAGELEFLEAHTTVAAAAGEPAGLPALHQRAAELAEVLGDRTRARGQWRALARLQQDHDGALRALARLSIEAQDWTPAADAMIRLARVTGDAAERLELFFGLGEIFDHRLPDPRRAEAAYRRALQLGPEDPRVLSRLADLYARTGTPDREAEMLTVLVPLTGPGAERVALQLRLARALDEGMGDTRRAEAALEAARREAPTDLPVLRAFARFYERQNATASLHVLLDRAAAEVRRDLDRRPTEAAPLALLADVLALRGRHDGVRLVAAVAAAVGTTLEDSGRPASDGTVPGVEVAALTPGALDLLSPPAVTSALREVLGRAADVLERVLPFDPRPLRAEKLGARPHPLRNEIERWARLVNLPSIEIYTAPQVPGLCLPVGRSPAAVVVPMAAALTPATRFAVARALLLIALALPLAVRSSPRELALVTSALLRQFEPMYRAEGVDAAQLDELARKITKALPRERHQDIAPFAYEVLGRGGVDADGIQAGSLELGDRVALLATGDVAGALAALTPEGMPPARAVTEVTAVGRLIRVALSDRFLEARHLAGADRMQPAGGAG